MERHSPSGLVREANTAISLSRAMIKIRDAITVIAKEDLSASCDGALKDLQDASLLLDDVAADLQENLIRATPATNAIAS